jgi:steroid delta-isomerase-like uncharacterized protein
MAEQRNRELARKLYEHWNAREFDRVAELIADDGEIIIVGSGTRFKGPDGSRQFSQMWADGFPDGKVTIDRLIDAGDTIIVEYTGRGTHTGTLRGAAGEIPATGRSVTLQLCDVVDIHDDKLTKVSSYFDSASLLQQLGVMPAATAEATTR